MTIRLSKAGLPIHVKEIYDDSIIPTRAHDDDAAFDLYSHEEALLLSNEVANIGVGIALEIPKGYAGLVLPRSGLAAKKGLTVLNTPGLIDPGYRGEVKVLLAWIARAQEHSEFKIKINKGDRIAQLLIVPYYSHKLTKVEILTHTARGESGIGSTGENYD